MKKPILTLILISCTYLITYAQKITEYKASNGIMYHLGDTVKLGRGSGTNGHFVYMVPSMINTSDTQLDWIKRKFSGSAVIIKKIEESETNGVKKYLFIVGAGAMYNLHLDIDNAIDACEVKPCNITTTTK